MPLQRPYSDLRASDTERERVVAFMREHALAGRLNVEELEERIGLAYAAVTVGDLERLIADLPRGHRPAPRPPAPPAHRPDFKPVLMVCGALFLALTVGPIVLGVGKPVAAMQNGATVEEIVNMTSHVVLQAQQQQQQLQKRA